MSSSLLVTALREVAHMQPSWRMALSIKGSYAYLRCDPISRLPPHVRAMLTESLRACDVTLDDRNETYVVHLARSTQQCKSEIARVSRTLSDAFFDPLSDAPSRPMSVQDYMNVDSLEK